MYILPTRSANKHILCQEKEDPLQHVYIFTTLFPHITALLEWSNYRVVHRRLWRTLGMQWCLLLWITGNPFPFPSLNPSAQICPVRFETIPLSVTDSACYHVTPIGICCPLLLQVEEFLSAFPLRQVQSRSDSFSLCVSGKAFTSPPYLNDNFSG